LKNDVTLYAKGTRKDNEIPPTVCEHCFDVLEMAKTLAEEIRAHFEERFARNDTHDFETLLYVAAVLHDFMKSNSAFQQMLTAGSDRKTQPVRHEILAAAILTQHKTVRDWFERHLTEDDFWDLVWAIGGHHFQMRLKRDSEAVDPMFRDSSVPSSVTLYLGHRQVTEIFAEVKSLLGSNETLSDLSDKVDLDPIDDGPQSLEVMVRKLVTQSDRAWKQRNKCIQNKGHRERLAFLKVLLVNADIAGSALTRSTDIQESPREWIRTQLSKTIKIKDIERIIEDNLQGRKPHDFQETIAESKNEVTIVAAGCGNGKTTAAYMWAKQHAVGRKLFFTYPTTGTASAGFKDYLFAQTGLERELIHGRSSVDLTSMWESSDIPLIERVQRLESLNAWGQQAIACTVDTVLGLIQNQRRSVFSFPAILKGAFVFDEVHSYDRRLFSELLRFLETFPNNPILIMSASIPPERLEHLKRVAGDRMNLEPIRGDEQLEAIKRYVLHQRTEEECWEEVEAILNSNNGDNSSKVLWVCNTVNDAKKAYDIAISKFPHAEVLLYHSRYRYGDRVQIQEEVIDEFRYQDEVKTIRKYQRSAIVITTQVCEMSLDISADLLCSAMCPLPSLVQRLGRLNRYAAKQSEPKPAFCFPFSGRPYHEHDAPEHLQASEQMIAELNEQPCSQLMLGEYVNRLQSNEELPEDSAWLDGGWISEQMPARERDNSITLIREEDVPVAKRLANGNYRNEDIIPLTIPMIYLSDFDFTARAAGYPIAPVGTVGYDWDEASTSGKGAQWQRRK